MCIAWKKKKCWSLNLLHPPFCVLIKAIRIKSCSKLSEMCTERIPWVEREAKGGGGRGEGERRRWEEKLNAKRTAAEKRSEVRKKERAKYELRKNTDGSTTENITERSKKNAEKKNKERFFYSPLAVCSFPMPRAYRPFVRRAWAERAGGGPARILARFWGVPCFNVSTLISMYTVQ